MGKTRKGMQMLVKVCIGVLKYSKLRQIMQNTPPYYNIYIYKNMQD